MLKTNTLAREGDSGLFFLSVVLVQFILDQFPLL